MFKYLLVTVIILFFTYPAFAENKEIQEEVNTVIDLMVTAKATGMCGVFHQMANFQEATKMLGGDEFIVRFFQTEAARLGHTLESFLSQCRVVTDSYNSTMDTLGADL